jgi:hypothetical protein
MTEEVQALAEVDSAPEQVVTAEPVAEEVVVTPEEKPVEQTPKTFSQEELDAAIGKRLAREQRKWEREQAARLAEMQSNQAPKEVPPADQFESPEAYAEALAVKKAEQLLAEREWKRQQAKTLDQYHDLEEKARDKYSDFEQVAYNPNLRITSVMAETIQNSDVGPDIAYYLGGNAKEAERISQLSPILQAKEIGRIEAKLASDPPAKRTTSAPPPITPVTSRASGNPTYDTTDPRSTKSMSTSEWIEAERLRQIKKWEAQRNR